MQKLILLLCSKLTLVLLFVLPLGLIAQSGNEAKQAQTQAEALFLQQNPQVKKVDLAKLQAEQKDQHKKCNTCGKKATAASSDKSSQTVNSLDNLKEEQKRILAIINHMQESGDIDKALYNKYQRALVLNQQRINVAEFKEATENKKKQNKSSK